MGCWVEGTSAIQSRVIQCRQGMDHEIMHAILSWVRPATMRFNACSSLAAGRMRQQCMRQIPGGKGDF